MNLQPPPRATFSIADIFAVTALCALVILVFKSLFLPYWVVFCFAGIAVAHDVTTKRGWSGVILGCFSVALITLLMYLLTPSWQYSGELLFLRMGWLGLASIAMAALIHWQFSWWRALIPLTVFAMLGAIACEYWSPTLFLVPLIIVTSSLLGAYVLTSFRLHLRISPIMQFCFVMAFPGVWLAIEVFLHPQIQ